MQKINIALLLLLFFPILLFSQKNGSPKKDLGELAKDMKNPVSLHYLLPFQNNFEVGDIDNQFRYNLKVEPVIPFVLNKNWKIITRTIVPIIANQYNGVKGNGESGLGDISLSGWLAPQKKVNGLIWGVGLAMDLPTDTDPTLGARKWTAGPSALMVKETGGWTLGLLVNQVWSYAGSGKQAVSYAFVDPWIGYTWDNGFGATIESESIFDWKASEQTIPLRAGVSQVIMLGKKAACINLDGLYYLDRPDYEAKWGISLTFTLLLDHTSYVKK